MRAGKLVQVGTPDEIYNQPTNRFVSEFMGEVNVLQVEAAGDGMLACPAFETRFLAPPGANGIGAGHLVIRPESLRFLERTEDAENALAGTLYNEYSLGSRFQYQIRVGDQVFLVEKLREHRYRGALDDAVTIGWDAGDSILVRD